MQCCKAYVTCLMISSCLCRQLLVSSSAQSLSVMLAYRRRIDQRTITFGRCTAIALNDGLQSIRHFTQPWRTKYRFHDWTGCYLV